MHPHLENILKLFIRHMKKSVIVFFKRLARRTLVESSNFCSIFTNIIIIALPVHFCNILLASKIGSVSCSSTRTIMLSTDFFTIYRLVNAWPQLFVFYHRFDFILDFFTWTVMQCYPSWQLRLEILFMPAESKLFKFSGKLHVAIMKSKSSMNSFVAGGMSFFITVYFTLVFYPTHQRFIVNFTYYLWAIIKHIRKFTNILLLHNITLIHTIDISQDVTHD